MCRGRSRLVTRSRMVPRNLLGTRAAEDPERQTRRPRVDPAAGRADDRQPRTRSRDAATRTLSNSATQLLHRARVRAGEHAKQLKRAAATGPSAGDLSEGVGVRRGRARCSASSSRVTARLSGERRGGSVHRARVRAREGDRLSRRGKSRPGTFCATRFAGWVGLRVGGRQATRDGGLSELSCALLAIALAALEQASELDLQALEL